MLEFHPSEPSVTHQSASAPSIPIIVGRGGERASKRFLEFFAATIRNRNTREAYYRACCRFLSWCEDHGIQNLAFIEPLHVATYVETLGLHFEKSTVKQYLAAIRMLLDWLVLGQIIVMNPATSVRGPKHIVSRGSTPVLTATETRQLLDSIDTSTTVGLRDRALIALMVYTFARVSAVTAMRVEDYYAQGKRWWVRLHEKGGKRHEMPAHHKLEEFMDAYLGVASAPEAKKGRPLFRSARARTDNLTDFPMSRIDVYRMIRRRIQRTDLKATVCCHSFRATGITTYLSNGGTLEMAQLMAGHESPRTTKLYDRTNDQVTLDEIERIVI
jgi:site-specific recombinase XerD